MPSKEAADAVRRGGRQRAGGAVATRAFICRRRRWWQRRSFTGGVHISGHGRAAGEAPAYDMDNTHARRPRSCRDMDSACARAAAPPPLRGRTPRWRRAGAAVCACRLVRCARCHWEGTHLCCASAVALMTPRTPNTASRAPASPRRRLLPLSVSSAVVDDTKARVCWSRPSGSAALDLAMSMTDARGNERHTAYLERGRCISRARGHWARRETRRGRTIQDSRTRAMAIDAPQTETCKGRTESEIEYRDDLLRTLEAGCGRLGGMGGCRMVSTCPPLYTCAGSPFSC